VPFEIASSYSSSIRLGTVPLGWLAWLFLLLCLKPLDSITLARKLICVQLISKEVNSLGKSSFIAICQFAKGFSGKTSYVAHR
jgi:hypothetical protein